jgi:hypothetical protein
MISDSISTVLFGIDNVSSQGGTLKSSTSPRKKENKNSRQSLSIELIDHPTMHTPLSPAYSNNSDGEADGNSPCPSRDQSNKIPLNMRIPKRKNTPQKSPNKRTLNMVDTNSHQECPITSKYSPPKRTRVREVDSDDEVFDTSTEDIQVQNIPQNSPKNKGNSPKNKGKSTNQVLLNSPANSLISNKNTITKSNIHMDNTTSKCSDIKSEHWRRYFSSSLDTELPCPGCGCLIGSEKNNYEIQSIIPWGCGADAETDTWNKFPLCSREESCGWGCSEKLEREGDVHAIDWMVQHYPQRLHEMAIRLQISHGKEFGMAAGNVICLKFLRAVYQEGCVRDGIDSPTRHEEWKRTGVGFESDILDIAECFQYHTDHEMIKIITHNRRNTPWKSNGRKLEVRNTGSGSGRRGLKSRRFDVELTESPHIHKSMHNKFPNIIHFGNDDGDDNEDSVSVKDELTSIREPLFESNSNNNSPVSLSPTPNKKIALFN